MTRPDTDQTQSFDQPSLTEPAICLRRYSADTTGDILEVTDEDGAVIQGIRSDGTVRTGGGSQPVTVQTTRLSSAQILALGAGTQVIVPAPGAGLAVVPIAVTVAQTMVTTPYTGTGFNLYYNNNANVGLSLANCLGALCASGFGFGVDLPFVASEGFEDGTLSDVENQPITLYSDAAGGDGAAVITVTYAIAATS